MQLLAEYRTRPIFQRQGYLDVSYKELLASASAVVASQISMRKFYHRNRVDVITGTARFRIPHRGG